jgi:hypothetical protein
MLMQKSHKTLIGFLIVGVIVVILIVGVAGFGVYSYVSAAVSPTPVPGQTSPSTSLMSQYWGLFLQTFASNLGVDQGKLNSAFIAAVNATVDQALKDGKITQSQADNIKNRYSNGLMNTPNGFGFMPFGRGFGKLGFRGNQLLSMTDIANALGMNVQDLASALQSGKSFADIAASQNKDLAQVKQTLLNDVKTKLDSQVANKTITQSQADQIYQNFSNSIDNMLNNTRPFRGFGGFNHKPFSRPTPNPGTL